MYLKVINPLLKLLKIDYNYLEIIQVFDIYFYSNPHSSPMTFRKVENVNNLPKIQTECEHPFIHFVAKGQ